MKRFINLLKTPEILGMLAVASIFSVVEYADYRAKQQRDRRFIEFRTKVDQDL